MFFLVSGAAASGKSTLAISIGARLENIEAHDADEKVYKQDPDRQRHLKEWLKLALKLQEEGTDFLLTSQTPFGELLACPLARQLQGISACLLDCSDLVRIRRMRGRGVDPRWPPDQRMLNWAAWHRMHAVDPQWEQDVVVSTGMLDYYYGVWTSWNEGDKRWQVKVIDTTNMAIEQVLNQIADWVKTERQRKLILTPEAKWWE